MEYYALYRNDLAWEKGDPPVGLIVELREYGPRMESMEYHAMHWSHRQKGWVYDPAGNADLMSDESYDDRRRPVTREEAEQITPAITGGEGLPDEETIRWIFQWKGAPPQAEDTPFR